MVAWGGWRGGCGTSDGDVLMDGSGAVCDSRFCCRGGRGRSAPQENSGPGLVVIHELLFHGVMWRVRLKKEVCLLWAQN